jgi:hypothetical protein
MNINLALIKLANMDAAGYLQGPSPTGMGRSLDVGPSSMGMVHEVEGQDPMLNSRLGMSEGRRFADEGSLSAKFHDTMDPAMHHVKEFLSTPGGQITAAAGLLGLGALSHHIATRGHRRPPSDDE